MSVIKKTAYGVLVSGVFLAVLELVARISLPFPLGTRDTYIADPDVLYFHRPSSRGYEVSPYREFGPVSVAYNKYGFRGTWEDIPKEKPVVLVVGDSFVEARQVEEEQSLVGRLSKLMANGFFVNAGCSAYTTTTEYLLLKRRLLSLNLKPSHVVLFFAFNDYRDNYVYQGGYFKHQELFSESHPPSELQPSDYVRPPARTKWETVKDHSALIANMERWLSRPPAPLPVPDTHVFQESFLSVNSPTEQLDPTGKEVLEFTHRGLLEISRLLRESSVGLTVFIIPLPMQVSDWEWSRGKSVYGSAVKMETARVYQDRIMQFCRDQGIDCIDLLPDFQKSSNDKRLFFDYDGHWTTAGNELVANVVARVLSQKGFKKNWSESANDTRETSATGSGPAQPSPTTFERQHGR